MFDRISEIAGKLSLLLQLPLLLMFVQASQADSTWWEEAIEVSVVSLPQIDTPADAFDPRLSGQLEERLEQYLLESPPQLALQFKLEPIEVLVSDFWVYRSETPVPGELQARPASLDETRRPGTYRAEGRVEVLRKQLDGEWDQESVWRFTFPEQSGERYQDKRLLMDNLAKVIVSEIRVLGDSVFSAQKRPRIAVVEFNDTTTVFPEQGFGQAVASMLTTQLKQESQFIIMERMSHKPALDLWRRGTRYENIKEYLSDLDAILIGDVTTLDGDEVQVDARLMGLDGRLLASASDGGSAVDLRDIANQVATKIQVNFLRPHTGRVSVLVQGPDLVEVEFFPVLTEGHLPEEYPPARAISAVSLSRDPFGTSDASPAEVWRTRAGVLELENLLKGWYSVRIRHDGYHREGRDGRRWQAVLADREGREDRCGPYRIEPKDSPSTDSFGAPEETEGDGCLLEADGARFVYVDDREDLEPVRFGTLERVEGSFALTVPPHLRRGLSYSVSSLSLDLDGPARERYDLLNCASLDHDEEARDEAFDAGKEPSTTGFRPSADTEDLLRRTECRQIEASAVSYNFASSFGQDDPESSSRVDLEDRKFPAGLYRLDFSHPDFVDATTVGHITRRPGMESTVEIALVDVGMELDLERPPVGSPPLDSTQPPLHLKQTVHLRRKLHGPFNLGYAPTRPDYVTLKRGPAGGNQLRVNTRGEQQQRDSRIEVDALDGEICFRLASDLYRISTSDPELGGWVKFVDFQSDDLKPGAGWQVGASGSVGLDDLLREPHCEAIKTGLWTAGLELQGDSERYHLADDCLPELLDPCGADCPEPIEARHTRLERRLRDVDLLVLGADTVSRVQQSSELAAILGRFVERGHAILAFVAKRGSELRIGPPDGDSLIVRTGLILRSQKKFDFCPAEDWGLLEEFGAGSRYRFRSEARGPAGRLSRPELKVEDADGWQEISFSRRCPVCSRKSRIVETHWPDRERGGFVLVWGDDVPQLGEILGETPSKGGAGTFSELRRAVEARAVSEAERLMGERLGSRDASTPPESDAPRHH